MYCLFETNWQRTGPKLAENWVHLVWGPDPVFGLSSIYCFVINSTLSWNRYFLLFWFPLTVGSFQNLDFIGNLIHQRHVNIKFSQSNICTAMQEVPLLSLLLCPKDNNCFSQVSFIKNFPPPPFLVPLWVANHFFQSSFIKNLPLPSPTPLAPLWVAN